jgi:flagellar motor protein MotB
MAIKHTANFNKQDMNTMPETGASSAIDLLSQAILPKVAELARAGKYQEAEGLLQHLLQEGAAIPALFELLAKILAQQGRLMEAQTYWVEALNCDRANEYYRAALKCVEHLQSHPAWTRKIGGWLLRLGLVCGVILLIWAARPYFHSIKIPHLNPLQTVKKIVPQHQTVIPSAKPPKVAVNIPGVLTHEQANQVIITFESGLFLHGAELLPEAKIMLYQLAEQLQSCQGQIRVQVEGHTDNVPIFNKFLYQDNVSLGLHRAVAVVEYLRLQGQFPAEMFTACALGELQALYPNDTKPNQLRNRTVVIRITGIKEE